MHHPKREFKYLADEGFQWLELPYLGDRLSMLILVPQERGQLAKAEKLLTAETLQTGVEKMKSRRGDVFLPRFRITQQLSILDDFRQMRLQVLKPFTAVSPSETLYLGSVIHKAYIAIDEEGT